ncbi:MAG: ferric reductase-like transmembrane domain-containing protein [Pseudomonadota bacterium]
MNSASNVKTYGIWLLLAAPGLWILGAFTLDRISYGQTLHLSGNWAVGLTALALAITPLRRLFHGSRWPMQLQRRRRAIGVASFAYAAFHTLVYLERKWGHGYILREAMRPELATGWAALLVFLLLAITSNDASVRRLGPGWKKLHRWIYPATGLVFAHWILTAAKPMTAWICAAMLGAVMLLRWHRHR